MSLKEEVVQELEDTDDLILTEVLDFLQFLKAKAVQEQEEDAADLAEAQRVLAEVAVEGTVAWEVLKAEVGL